MKTKLEEILGVSLPTTINESISKPSEKLEVKKIYRYEFIRTWKYGNQFNFFDYPDLLDSLVKNVNTFDTYCLIKPSGISTLSIIEAYQETPINKFPYLELNIFKAGNCRVVILLYVDRNGDLKTYIPNRGNTIRLDKNRPISDSKTFDFKWENKDNLEQSDLLFIMKDVNRPALCEYKLKDIYEAFQEYKQKDGVDDIITPNRTLCIQEFETALKFVE